MIRVAVKDDLGFLPEIEIAAGEQFRDLGMPEISDDAAPTVGELAKYQEQCRLWVALDEFNEPVAYLLGERLADSLHIEQVTVHPAHGRQGIGGALIETAAEWARDHKLHRLTLTTFAEVPWNAPYYRRLGFREFPENEIGTELLDIQKREAAHGLAKWPRVVMHRPL